MGQVYCVLVTAFQDGLRSSAMPQTGQSPGFPDSAPGHMGQKYFAEAGGVTEGSWE
jgi:hypothetical protein